MTAQVQGFQAPKNGSNPEECQDAVAWDEKNGVYAIADGVSDSAFQGLWARLLVDSFVANAASPVGFTKEWVARWLMNEQEEWRSRVNWEAVPWHGRMKAQQTGGQATFLGLRLLPENNSWSGFAIGDCNLFRFNRDHAFIESVPLQRSADFSNATQAFSSIRTDYDQLLSQVKFIHGNYEPGDTLALATDAMARWVLERVEEQRDPLKEIPASREADFFHQWVNSQRQTGRIKDDDTSLLVIRVEPVKAGTAPSPRLETIPTKEKVRPKPPLAEPLPAPRPQRQPARRLWAAVYLAFLLAFTITGFGLGASWQNGRVTRRLERDVQKPLLEWVNTMDQAEIPAKSEIQKVILETIVTIQPKTATGKQVYCLLNPAEASCNPSPLK